MKLWWWFTVYCWKTALGSTAGTPYIGDYF
jgi:hypothetical protein